MCSLGIPKKEVRIFTAISTETVLEKIREEAGDLNRKLYCSKPKYLVVFISFTIHNKT